MFKPVTHVIFDMDGLIFDSETIYETVYDDISVKYTGKKCPATMKVKARGVTDEKAAKIVIEDMGLPISVDEFMKLYKPLCAERLQHPDLMPGVDRLILHLHQHKIPLAIATSGGIDMTLTKMQNYPELFSCFDHIVCGGSDPEVKNGKPNPDIFQVCASRFPDNPDPEKCLVLEDSPAGALGGFRAGMQVIMVPAPEVSEVLKKPATLVLKSLEDIRPELFGLPAYDN